METDVRVFSSGRSGKLC